MVARRGRQGQGGDDFDKLDSHGSPDIAPNCEVTHLGPGQTVPYPDTHPVQTRAFGAKLQPFRAA
jgi:hypothetical protein